MKKNFKITLVLTFLLFTTFTVKATSSGATIDLTDATTTSGTGWTLSGYTFTIQNGANVTITGNVQAGRNIVVAANATASITLQNASVSQTMATDSHGNIVQIGTNLMLLQLSSGANVTLTLIGTNTFNEGIQAPTGTTLTINGSGTLTTNGLGGGAGIGGGVGQGGGNITINSGTITAVGSMGSAGIGGGYGQSGGNITINGGIVTATGGISELTSNSACQGGTICVYNGGGAGIGGGGGGASGNITICGNAQITATGGAGYSICGGGAGIGGGGNGSKNTTVNNGVITIGCSSQITATGGSNSTGGGGAGIGAGGAHTGSASSNAGTISIGTSTSVTATGGTGTTNANGANIGTGGSATSGAGTESLYLITSSANANGSINPSGCNGISTSGNQTYAITPNTGYVIDQVLIDGTNNATAVSAGSYTFTNVTANHTISVSFKQATYTITASAGNNGSISPSGSVSVNQGSNQTFTFTTNTGYVIDQVLIDGTNNATAVSAGSYTFTNVTAAHTISVSFKQIQYTITASAGSNGSISPNGNVIVNYGSNQAFSFTPNSGYDIDQVLIDGTNNTAAVSAGSYTFTNVTANHTISVSFKQKPIQTYMITASAGSGGSISPSGSITVNQGSNQTFTFTTNTGYVIDQVLIDGSNNATAVSAGSYTFTNVTAAHTISVSFKQIQYTITASAGGNGSISPNGNVTVNQGNNQTFTFTPNSGYDIDQVLVDGTNNATAVSTGSYTFTNVTANHTISVSFKQKPIPTYTITASTGSGGNISPSGNVTVNQGNNQTFSFTPYSGYEISQVFIDGTNNATAVSSGSYTFTNITDNHTISVTFTQVAVPTYTINASAGNGGSISPSGNVSVSQGNSQTFYFYSNAGYEINQVLVDGTNNTAAVSSGAYTFTNVTSNHTISVTFTQVAVPTYTINASAGSGGGISPNGNVSVNQGDNQEFYFYPNAGYEIEQVLVDGTNNSQAVSSGSYSFNNVTVAHTIYVSFQQIQYTITASAGNNGSISPNGNVIANYGSNQTFNFTPNAGYEINQVLIDGTNNAAAVSAGSYTFTNVTTNHTISVTFKQEAVPTFTINASAGSGGSISPTGSISVSQGDSQIFTFTPNTGYDIDQVLVDGTNNASAVSAGSYTFTNVTADHTISVTFKQTAVPTYTITASASSGGLISPSGAVSVNQGDSKTFTFTPNSGYDIDQVLIDGTNNTAAVSAGSYTFTNVTANHTISVSFKQQAVPTYTITASAGSGGGISPSGAVSVNQGDSKTFTISPNTDYDIDQVLIDGTNNATAVSAGSYTFTNVTANHTISVSFKQKPVPTYTITASASSGGLISPSGAVSVNQGDSKPFTFTPNTNYSIADVLIDGVSNASAIASGSYTFTNVTSNHTISVSFVPECLSNIIVQVWDDVLSVINNPANNGGYTFTGYQWLKNGVEIAGETSGNLYLTNDADKTMSDYTCRVTTSNGLTLQSCPLQVSAKSSISAYPNPTDGTIIVESSALKEGDKINVYGSAGTLVKQYLATPNQTKIDLGNQPKGVYIIKVNGKQVKIILL